MNCTDEEARILLRNRKAGGGEGRGPGLIRSALGVLLLNRSAALFFGTIGYWVFGALTLALSQASTLGTALAIWLGELAPSLDHHEHHGVPLAGACLLAVVAAHLMTSLRGKVPDAEPGAIGAVFPVEPTGARICPYRVQRFGAYFPICPIAFAPLGLASTTRRWLGCAPPEATGTGHSAP